MFIVVITGQLAFAFLMDYLDISFGFKLPLMVFYVSPQAGDSIVRESPLLAEESLPFPPPMALEGRNSKVRVYTYISVAERPKN